MRAYRILLFATSIFAVDLLPCSTSFAATTQGPSCLDELDAAFQLFDARAFEAAARRFSVLAEAGSCGDDDAETLAGYAFRAWEEATELDDPDLVLRADNSLDGLVRHFQNGMKNPLLEDSEKRAIRVDIQTRAQSIREARALHEPREAPSEGDDENRTREAALHPDNPPRPATSPVNVVLGVSAGLATVTLTAGLSLHGTRLQSAALYGKIYRSYSELGPARDQSDMCAQANRNADATLDGLCGEHNTRGVAANVLLGAAAMSATAAIVSAVFYARAKKQGEYASRLNLAAAPRLEGGAMVHASLRF